MSQKWDTPLLGAEDKFDWGGIVGAVIGAFIVDGPRRLTWR
jgi:hypothetical protein